MFYMTLNPIKCGAFPPLGRLLSGVANPPNGLGAVVGNQQRAIRSDRNADGAPPNVSIIHDESGHEILIFPARVTALMQRYSNHFISHADRSIPGSMLGGENIALVFRRELLAVVKSHFQRGIVRMKYHVRSDDFVF